MELDCCQDAPPVRKRHACVQQARSGSPWKGLHKRDASQVGEKEWGRQAIACAHERQNYERGQTQGRVGPGGAW